MNKKPRLRRAPSIRKMKKKITTVKRQKSPRPQNRSNLLQKRHEFSKRRASLSVSSGSISIDFSPFSGMDQSRRRYDPDGLLLIWHENGQLLIECDYLDGERFGKFSSWYEDGTKSQVSYWAYGLKSGPREMWNKTGEKIVYDYWIKGVRIEEHFNLLKSN